MGAETLNTIEYFKRTKRKWFNFKKTGCIEFFIGEITTGQLKRISNPNI